MNEEQIMSLTPGMFVEVKPDVLSTGGWYVARIIEVTREQDDPSGPLFTSIKVWCSDMKRPYCFTGPMLKVQVRIPAPEVKHLQAQLECLRADLRAFKQLADDRLAEIKRTNETALNAMRDRDDARTELENWKFTRAAAERKITDEFLAELNALKAKIRALVD